LIYASGCLQSSADACREQAGTPGTIFRARRLIIERALRKPALLIRQGVAIFRPPWPDVAI